MNTINNKFDLALVNGAVKAGELTATGVNATKAVVKAAETTYNQYKPIVKAEAKAKIELGKQVGMTFWTAFKANLNK